MTILHDMTATLSDMTYKIDNNTYDDQEPLQYSPNNDVIPKDERSSHDDVMLNEEDALRVVDTCVRKNGVRYYKICWKDSWEREDCLQGFDKLIRAFWEDLETKRNSDRMDVENNNEISTTSSYYDDVIRKVPSPQMNIPTGRRKGRPKKLINFNCNESDGSSQIPDEQADDTLEKPSTPTKVPTTNFQPTHKHPRQPHITLPDNRNIEKTSAIEEYPVMILNESNDGSSGNMNDTSVPVITSHSYGTNAKRFIHKSELSPNRKRAMSHIDAQSEMPKKHIFTTSQIFMGRQFAASPPKDFPSKYSHEKDYHTSHFSPTKSYPSRSSPSKGHSSNYSTSKCFPTNFSTATDYFSGYSQSKVYLSNRLPVLKSLEQSKQRELPHAYPETRNDFRSSNLEKVFGPLNLERHPVIDHTQRHIERIKSTSELLLTVTSAVSNPRMTTIDKIPSDKNKETPKLPPEHPSQAIGQPKLENNSLELSNKSVKLGEKVKTPMLYQIAANGEQRPQCAECFQTFKKRAALERHMMIHRGIKPFQCHFCNQRFRQKHHLQGHIMLHTGERPHSCELCSKRFRMRHHLLEHERISHKLFR